mgnify:CR=1 FL=1
MPRGHKAFARFEGFEKVSEVSIYTSNEVAGCRRFGTNTGTFRNIRNLGI